MTMGRGAEALEPGRPDGAAGERFEPARESGRLVLLAILSTVLSVLPVYLTGALAFFVRSDLEFSASRLAVAVSVFYMVAGVASPFAGYLGQRMGGQRGMIVAAGLSGLALLGMATVTTSWLMLISMLAVAGLGNSLAQPSANLVVAKGVSVRRQGVAFGLKQSAVPAASIMAGLSVPLLGSTIGWRWAIALASLGAVGIIALMTLWGRRPATGRSVRTAPSAAQAVRTTRPPAEGVRSLDGPLVLLACVAGLGMAASNSLGPFYVESGVAHGLSVDAAGMLLALGGGVAIVARVTYGWLADRRGAGHLQFVAIIMLLGAGGLLMYSLAHLTSTPLLIVGTLLMFALAWGWNGLFTFAIVRRYAHAEATATGITMAGTRAGGIVGPLGFGLVLEMSSYRSAWLAAAVTMLLSALLLLVVRGLMRRRTAELITKSEGARPA